MSDKEKKTTKNSFRKRMRKLDDGDQYTTTIVPLQWTLRRLGQNSLLVTGSTCPTEQPVQKKVANG